MSGWLTGKRVWIEGDNPDIFSAVESAGAVRANAGDEDIWIHVAPPRPIRRAHDLSHAEWRATLEVGLDHRFLGAKAFADRCRARGQGGAILFVSSPEQALGADHAAAAGALGNLTKTLGVEWARDGIRVNSIFTRSAGTTLGHLAAYLVSDYAAYVTGAVMGIDIDD